MSVFDETPADESSMARDAAFGRAAQHKPHLIIAWIDGEADAARLDGLAVPVVTLGRRIEHPRVIGSVAVDWAAAAERLAAEFETLAGEGRGYLLVHTAGRDAAGSAARQRFGALVTRERGARLLGERDARDAAGVRAAARELVGEFSHTTLLVVLDPAPWVDPLTLRDLRGMNGRLRVAALGAGPTARAAVRHGEWQAAAGPLPAAIGWAAADIASSPLMGVRLDVPHRTIGVELITPATVADIARRAMDPSRP